MDIIRAFFPKSGHFFLFSNKDREGLPPSPLSCASAPSIIVNKVKVDKYKLRG